MSKGSIPTEGAHFWAAPVVGWNGIGKGVERRFRPFFDGSFDDPAVGRRRASSDDENHADHDDGQMPPVGAGRLRHGGSPRSGAQRKGDQSGRSASLPRNDGNRTPLRGIRSNLTHHRHAGTAIFFHSMTDACAIPREKFRILGRTS